MGQNYDNSTAPTLNYYTFKTKRANLKPTDIIATSLTPDSLYNLNFTSQQSVIAFNEKTIQDLLTNNKLKNAFDYFKVTHILGYNPELSNQILKADKDIKIISDNNISPEPISLNKNNKNWLLNLVK